MSISFKAIVVRENKNGTFSRQIEEKKIEELPAGEVLVRVEWSSLNYKDALSATGNRGVTRKYPHTPGIDCAGIIEASETSAFSVGDAVIVTSYDLGMNTSGGFAEYVRVPVEWVVPLPETLTTREAMCYGTAGFTAGLSVRALTDRLFLKKLNMSAGEIVVTGATGGVGSMAVAILAKLGCNVTAVSGKTLAKDFLQELGVSNIISRDEFCRGAERPLMKSRWLGGIDCVGGDILAALIKATDSSGVVTCCGNAASPDLPITVFPFILRGVELVGIDSQNCPMVQRSDIWERLGGKWKLEKLAEFCKEVPLEELSDEIDLILQGRQQGRVIVRLS